MYDFKQLLRRNAVRRVGGEVQEGDFAQRIDDHIGTQLERVVATCDSDGLSSAKRPQPGEGNAWTKNPERCGPPGPESPVQRSLGIGDHERAREAEPVAPNAGASTGLRSHDDEGGACF